MSQLTTHILDTSKGKPAANVTITLYQNKNDAWTQIAAGQTNSDGRLPGLLPDDALLENGVYKFRFDTKDYFDGDGIQTFYPFIEIAFQISSAEHYHVPLLLNPFGYSSYRGS